MKKLLLIGFLALFAGSQAHASFISNITSADMAGIQITGTFADNSTETLTWGELAGFPTPGTNGVEGTGWSLSLAGETFGEFDNINNVLVGAWTLALDSTDTLSSLFIDLGTDFVFDTAFGIASGNDSGPGVTFDSNVLVTHVFGGFVQDELYSTLTLSNFTADDTIFLTDTDAVVVSAPATLSIIMFSLFGLMMNARRKQA